MAAARRAGAARCMADQPAAPTSHAPFSSSSPPPPLPLVAANVYISEGRHPAVLEAIVSAIVGTGAVVAPSALPWRGGVRPSPSPPPASSPSAALLHAFPDAAYNRTGFTLVGEVDEGGDGSAALAAAVVAASVAGLERIDLRDLRGPGGGDHPTLGVVDHVAVHPLGGDGADIARAVSVARAVAAGLGGAGVPAFLYGAAARAPAHATLAGLRRALGYFRPPLAPGGAGGGGPGDESAFPDPDFGPAGPAPPALGRAAVGATPWVVNWNIPLRAGPAAPAPLGAALAASIARAVSTRGGSGLAGVEALALPHGEGGEAGGGGGGAWPWEVATNLRDPASAPPSAVEAAVRSAAAKVGLEVGAGYCTGLDPAELAAAARRALMRGGEGGGGGGGVRG